MVGAGVSVSAGIPDFRTPGTGLYDNLQEYGLPDPQAIFDLNFFSTNPQPFYRLCKELWPGQHEPTKAHHFIKLLDNKGMLRRCYSQNIDSLESTAGLPAEKLVAAHGNFDSATVRRDDGSSAAVPVDEVRVAAATEGMAGWDALNAKHGGLVKPDIVFFGEQLPGRFFSLLRDDFPACDLLIVMGTSLAVYPFAALIAQVSPDTPRLLVNRERVGDGALGGPIGPSGAFDFDGAQSMDRFYQGDCDDACEELARRLGAAPTRKSKSATWLSVDEIREQMRSDPKDKPLKVWGKEPL